MDSDRQRVHYEEIHDEYEAHYYDRHSLRYRERFIFAPILNQIDLNDCDMLDLASQLGA